MIDKRKIHRCEFVCWFESDDSEQAVKKADQIRRWLFDKIGDVTKSPVPLHYSAFSFPWLDADFHQYFFPSNNDIAGICPGPGTSTDL